MFRYTEGLGLIARAGLLLFAPIMSDRTHRDAANRCDGLRKRSAGAAAEMFLRNGHWNNFDAAYCRPRAKRRFFLLGEDCVTTRLDPGSENERFDNDNR